MNAWTSNWIFITTPVFLWCNQNLSSWGIPDSPIFYNVFRIKRERGFNVSSILIFTISHLCLSRVTYQFQLTCWSWGTGSSFPKAGSGLSWQKCPPKWSSSALEMTMVPVSHVCHLDIPSQRIWIVIGNRCWKLVLLKVAFLIFPTPPGKQPTGRSLRMSKPWVRIISTQVLCWH